MVLKIYIDSCIFLAYYYETETDRFEHVKNCFEVIEKYNDKIQLVTSDFTFTEFVKVSKNPKNIPQDRIFKDLSNIARQKKIGKKYPFKIIEAEGKHKNYTFSDFFVELQETLLYTRPGLADTIHYQIMKNNNVKRILTFDVDDFSKLPDITVIHPNQIHKMFTKK